MKRDKSERLSRCIGESGSDFIEEAEDYRPRLRKLAVRRLAYAACLCALLGSLLCFGIVYRNRPLTGPELVSGKSDNSGTVDVPALEISEPQDGVQTSMIGLIVYRGGIYTMAELYQGGEAQKLTALVGENLGTATGGIDEWSEQSEYERELASNVTGDVFAVNGYSTDFRICLKSEDVINEAGDTVESIAFFERLNGISLSAGKEMFDDRLKLPGNYVSVSVQSHEDWDAGKPLKDDCELKNVSGAQIDSFLKAVCAAQFEYVYETNDNFYSDGKSQVHLFFELEDGTKVELRLFEGGYVGYQHLGWYFVKIPGAAFDTVFSACFK